MDRATFELKRAEIQKRMQARRFALDAETANGTSGWMKFLLRTAGEAGVSGALKMVGDGMLVRNLAGTAVSFLINRWVHKKSR